LCRAFPSNQVNNKLPSIRCYLVNTPEGLVGRSFKKGKYKKFIAKGEMPNAVVEMWKEIWQLDEELNHRFTADYEIHGIKSQNGKDSEVVIFISVK